MSKMGLPPPAVSSILVVDDEPDILEGFRDMLVAEIPGVQVSTAKDGHEALRILDGQKIDVILCDYRMPGIDGLRVLIEARTKAPDAARILITAYPELQVAVRAINEAQVHNFLTKSAQPRQILEAVNAALLKVRSLRSQAEQIAQRSARAGLT